MSNQIEIPNFSIPDLTVDKTIVSKSFLIKRLHAAAGPSSVQDGTNVSNEEANRYWPNQNQNWAGDFGDIAGAAIATSLNSVLKDQNKALSSIKDQLNISLQGLDPFFNELGKSLFLKVDATNKRSQLLWWKETLYSSIIGESYRSMNPITSAITMAADLSLMVDQIYPESVDFLLMESLKSVHGDQVDTESVLADLIDEASEMEEREKLLLQSLKSSQTGRKPLGTALANKWSGDSSDLFVEIGLEKDAKVTLANFSVWLFHDLQSQKIVTKK